MATKFRLEPLPIEEFLPLFKLNDEELHKRSAKWLVADTKPGYPCRVTLADAEVGERVLAVPFIHHDVQSPYRASGPVFVRENAQTVNLEVNEIPVMFHHRLLSLRAYDSDGMMLDAKVIQGTELEQAIVDHFENCDVEYQHIHNANPGCYDCTVRRTL